MPGEEFRRTHSAAALQLQLFHPQGIRPAGDAQPGSIRFQQMSRRAVSRLDCSAPNLQQTVCPVLRPESVGSRPRSKGPDLVPQNLGGLRPIQMPVLFGDFARISGQSLILRFARDVPGNEAGRVSISNSAPNTAKRSCRLAAVCSERMGVVLFVKISPVSNPAVIFMMSRRFPLIIQKGPLNGRRAAVFREQRSVDINAAKLGQIQNRLRQNLPVGRNDYHFGIEFRQSMEKRRVPGAFLAVKSE